MIRRKNKYLPGVMQLPFTTSMESETPVPFCVWVGVNTGKVQIRSGK